MQLRHDGHLITSRDIYLPAPLVCPLYDIQHRKGRTRTFDSRPVHVYRALPTELLSVSVPLGQHTVAIHFVLICRSPDYPPTATKGKCRSEDSAPHIACTISDLGFLRSFTVLRRPSVRTNFVASLTFKRLPIPPSDMCMLHNDLYVLTFYYFDDIISVCAQGNTVVIRFNFLYRHHLK